MGFRSGRLCCVVLLFGAASSLAGCDTIRAAAGNDKQPPDEFSVVTKAPLIIPPDYNLRPPRPGAAPSNQTEPTEAAEQSLFGTDPSAIAKAMPGDESAGEKLLLANAGAQNASPSIRQDIAADRNRSLESASDDFTNTVLFWQKPDTDEGLDAATAAKSAAAQPSDAKATAPDSAKPDASPADPNAPAAEQPASIEKDKKSGGGWFDWF